MRNLLFFFFLLTTRCRGENRQGCVSVSISVRTCRKSPRPCVQVDELGYVCVFLQHYRIYMDIDNSKNYLGISTRKKSPGPCVCIHYHKYLQDLMHGGNYPPNNYPPDSSYPTFQQPAAPQHYVHQDIQYPGNQERQASDPRYQPEYPMAPPHRPQIQGHQHWCATSLVMIATSANVLC